MVDQAERPSGLAMPKAPVDVFDRIRVLGPVPAVTDRVGRPPAGTLIGMLDANRMVKPVEYMINGPDACGLSQRSGTVGAVAQDRHLRFRGHAETGQHAAQLRSLPVGDAGYAAEQDRLSIVIADLAAITSNVLP